MLTADRHVVCAAAIPEAVMAELQDVYLVDESKFDTVMWVDSALTYGDEGITGIIRHGDQSAVLD